MKSITRTAVSVLGCNRQEVVVVGGITYWHWIAPGCPFSQEDVTASCKNCVNFVVTQPPDPQDGDPIDSGYPLEP